ncbi:hypothetical protein WA158_004299 [Blastocystis sp. Blastoise]
MSGCGKAIRTAYGRTWHLVDASGHNLGRLSTQISALLTGKGKPIYSPHDDQCGDYVVVINAKDIEYNDKTRDKKVYYWHTGYPGHLKERTLKELSMKHPEQILEKAVYGMLPDNKLRKGRMDRLKIYMDDQHNHHAQIPINQVATISSQYPKQDKQKWMVLGDAPSQIPQDWGRVLGSVDTFEKGYKSPFDLDFEKLHKLYLDAHPHERVKEEQLIAGIKELQIESEKIMKQQPKLIEELLTKKQKKSKK